MQFYGLFFLVLFAGIVRTIVEVQGVEISKQREQQLDVYRVLHFFVVFLTVCDCLYHEL